MSDSNASGFGAFVPGFDFLQNLVQSASKGTAGGLGQGMPDWSKWIAPTLKAEEIEKRVGELKTVQFWLEQNARALAATIQALEVQKMTLATLRTMNVQVADMAGAFGFGKAAVETAAPSAPIVEPRSAPRAPGEPGPYDDMYTHRPDAAPDAAQASAEAPAPEAAPAGAVDAPSAADPLQWWNALTGQFQQIAASAMQDAARQARENPAAGLQNAALKAFDTAGKMAAGVAAVASAATTVPARRRSGATAKKPSVATKAAKAAKVAKPAAVAARPVARKAAPAKKALAAPATSSRKR